MIVAVVDLTDREIAALIEVSEFELNDVPDDFWSDATRAALASSLAKLQASQEHP